jgi:hypothetical protein
MASGLLMIALITAVFVGSVSLVVFGYFCFTGQVRPRSYLRRHRSEEIAPVHRPIERVAADLRRLAHQIALVPAGAPVARRRGLQAAYDDVLIEAADLLQVDHALTGLRDGHARDVERLRLNAELKHAGLVIPD